MELLNLFSNELAIGGVSIAVLVEIVVKLAKHYGVPKKHLPAVGIVWGVILGVTSHFLVGVSLVMGIIGGLLLGASSTGFYEAKKNLSK